MDEYKELPVIPGQIWRLRRLERFSFQLIILTGIFAISLFAFPSFSIVVALLIPLSFLESFILKRNVLTEVDGQTVSARFEFREDVTGDDLSQYIICLAEHRRTRGYTSNYRYHISLQLIDQETEEYIGVNKKSASIILMTDILCPLNLKEWVESFQQQITTPLPVMFSSEVIKNDYQTGVYRSLEQ